MVTDKQVQLLSLKMAQGKTVEAAAAAAGMSAHTWKEGALPSQTKRQRHWRTRVDVFADVWESEVVPLLERDEAGVLEATTMIAELGRVHGQRFTDKHLRTLQRRVRDWRAMHGPEREVFFDQQHVPGREAAVDFTDCTSLGVRVAGQPLRAPALPVLADLQPLALGCARVQRDVRSTRLRPSGSILAAWRRASGGSEQ